MSVLRIVVKEVTHDNAKARRYFNAKTYFTTSYARQPFYILQNCKINNSVEQYSVFFMNVKPNTKGYNKNVLFVLRYALAPKVAQYHCSGHMHTSQYKHIILYRLNMERETDCTIVL